MPILYWLVLLIAPETFDHIWFWFAKVTPLPLWWLVLVPFILILLRKDCCGNRQTLDISLTIGADYCGHGRRPVSSEDAEETLCRNSCIGASAYILLEVVTGFCLIKPESSMEHNQSSYQLRCDWGENGIRSLTPISDIVVIVDLLWFSTCVDVAVSRGQPSVNSSLNRTEK